MRTFTALSLLFFFVTACSKYEGTGGRATIKGKIYVKQYNESFTQLLDEYYAAEEDVYIIYGDHDVYDDDMKTNFDGKFEFSYLERGNYKIFVYSEDSTFNTPGGKEAIFIDIEIKEKKDVIELDDIVIIRT